MDSLADLAKDPQGFERFKSWVEEVRAQHKARIIAVSGGCTGAYYRNFWCRLKQGTDHARVLYNARPAEHVGEVLSTHVHDDVTDAYLIAKQFRLGSTLESPPSQDLELLEARACSRFARDIANEINHKKNQVKSLIRTLNPAFYRSLPEDKFRSALAQAPPSRLVEECLLLVAECLVPQRLFKCT